MKKFKLNKIGRRFWRTMLSLFILLVVWNIYYFSTWDSFPDHEKAPITYGIEDTAYANEITIAKEHLKGVIQRLEVPSFSVAVGHEGAVVWSASEGYQDIESETPATPKTQYRLGSTSKSITATGVAKLVDAGKLNLETIIGDTIVNWTKKRWDFSMRQLLSHTAGVGNYTDFGVASGKYTLCNCYEFKSASEGLKVFDRYKLLYEPGTSFAYSTFDINLASVVLEQAASQPFLSYMDEKVFHPLGMTSTYADHAKPKSEHFATFYQMEQSYYREYRIFERVYDINLSYKWAGGGFIGTPTDMVKMGNALLNDSTFVSKSTLKKFWTPQKLNDGSINEQEYALGFRSWLTYENQFLGDGKTPYWMVHHGGVSKGSMNFLVIFPNYNLVLDASINARVKHFGDFAAEVRQLANIFLQSIERNELPMYQEIKKVSDN